MFFRKVRRPKGRSSRAVYESAMLAMTDEQNRSRHKLKEDRAMIIISVGEDKGLLWFGVHPAFTRGLHQSFSQGPGGVRCGSLTSTRSHSKSIDSFYISEYLGGHCISDIHRPVQPSSHFGQAQPGQAGSSKICIPVGLGQARPAVQARLG